MDSSEFQSAIVLELAEEFLDRYRQGQRPALKEYIDRHPELADEIRDVFPAIAMIENIAICDGSLDGNSTGDAPRPAAARLEQLGDYRIIREVGHGGMGVVYEAEQVSLGRHVALKVLPRSMVHNAKQLQRFEREAKAAARLHHSNIVPVFGAGEQDGTAYYVMQFIAGLGLNEVFQELKRLVAGKAGAQSFPPGGQIHVERRESTAADLARSLLSGRLARSMTGEVPLSDRLAGALAEGTAAPEPSATARPSQTLAPEIQAVPAAQVASCGRLSDSFTVSASSAVLPGKSGDGRSSRSRSTTYWQSVAQIGIQVGQALDYAHKQGILHRDIKPSNLLLDTDGTVWITDFGLAKADDHLNLTDTGDILGTLRYIPPEAFEGKADARGDVYALGLTLYELLALRPAFNEKDRGKLIMQVTHEEPARLAQLNRDVPRDLETIVHKAIDRDPDHRYATAGALTADLQRFLDDEPILARRLTSLEKLLRWSRRNRGLAASLTAILLLLSLMAIGSGAAALWYRDSADRNEGLAWEKDLTSRIALRARDDARAASARAETARAQEARERARAEASLYLSHITLADSALRATETGTADRALLQCVPSKDAPDPRGWEWYYLAHWLQADRRRFAGHSPPVVTNIAFSPDGTILASAGGGNPYCDNPGEPSYPGQVILRDPRTGRVSHRLEGHQNLIGPLAFSGNGRRLATASVDRVIKVWDVATGQPLATFAGSPTSRILRLQFFPDGRRLACLSESDGVSILVADTGRVLQAFPGQSMAMSPDGTCLAVCLNQDVRVHQADSGRLLYHAPGRGMVFSPDGQRLFVADPRDDAIHALDSATGREQAVLRGAGTPQQGRLILDHSGRYLADQLDRSSLGIWDTAEGRFARRITLPAGVEFTLSFPATWGLRNALAFSRDGSMLAAITGEKTAWVWDVASGKEQAVLLGHAQTITSLAFSPGGEFLATSSTDGTVRLWDPRRRPGGLALSTGGGYGYMAALEFSPDGSTLHTAISAPNAAALETWDATSGRRRDRHQIDATRQMSWPRNDFAFSPDRRYLAAPTAGNRAVLALFDVATGRELAALRWHVDPINAVAFSPDGHRLASAALRDDLTSWDVTTWDPAAGAEVRTFPPIAATEIRSLAFSPDGRTLAVGGWRSSSGFVDLLDLESGTLTRSWNEGRGIYSLAFRPDGAQLAGGDFSRGAVHVWEVATGKKLQSYDGIPSASCVAYSPDGRRLAGMGYSGEVHLWDARSGQEMLILRPFAPPPGTLGFTPRLAFSPDGSRIAANSAQGIITIWDAGADAVSAFRELQSPLAAESPDPSLLKRRAELAVRSGRWDAAVEDSSRRLERDPDDRDTLLIRARANLALDNLEPAASDVDRGLQLIPEDRPFLALAGEIHDLRGRRLMDQEHPEEARKSWDRARSTYETLLRLGPDRAAAAARLADVLLQSRDLEARPPWITLRPLEMKSAGGASLTVLPDGSILAGGKDPDRDTYTLVFRTRLEDVTAIRLEALPHRSLPDGGCGRNSVDGGFRLRTLRIGLAHEGAPGGFRPLTFARATCDGVEPGQFGIEAVLDHNHRTFWTTGPGARSRGPHWAKFVLDRPFSANGEIALRVTLVFADEDRKPQNLGRFRFSATQAPRPLLNLEEMVYPKLSGWTRLAAAFALRGEWSAALDVLGKAEADPSGGCGEDRFLLAWVNHRLGQNEEARRSLDRAIAWMEEHGSGGELSSLALAVMPEVLGISQAEAARRITRAAGEWPIARLSREIERQPNSANARYQRGEYLSARGDWSRAADDLAVAVEQVPDNAMFHYQLALARLFSGDLAGYRTACAAALNRFGATADPGIANRVLFACVFRPDTVEDLAALDRLARRAGAAYPGGEHIVGAALCRAGRYEEALKQFDLAQRVHPPRAFDLAFLAMCHAHLGHDQLARRVLKRTNRWIDEADQAPIGDEGVRPSWINSYEQYGSKAVLREAEELILDAGFPADPFAP